MSSYRNLRELPKVESIEDILEDIYLIIRHVETNNNPTLIGDSGKAFGVVQIHKGAVKDVNRFYKTNYKHQDAFDPECAKELFILYLKIGVSRFSSMYNKLPTEQDIVRMWNGGIYRGYKKQSTVKYYKKYIRYKTLLNE